MSSRAQSDARYNRSEKGRARHRRYNASEKGYARSVRYEDRHIVVFYEAVTGSKRRVPVPSTPEGEQALQRLFDKLRSMLDRLDLHEHLIPRNLYMKNEIGIAGVAHQAGTCRFGTDPRTSVLDTDCKAHELDNLYVVDTSFFPSIGAVNPALTAMANALRVGDHLLERLG